MTTFYADGNYWGGVAPNTNPLGESISYYGPGTFSYSNYDTEQQTRVPTGAQNFSPILTGKDAGNVIANEHDELEEEAFEAFADAIELEEDRVLQAIAAYQGIISDYCNTSIAPMAVERILWATRNAYNEDNRRFNALRQLDSWFIDVADTTGNRDLAWKARRAALWAKAAQHRYDEAIAGFEAIIQNPDCLADSVFAVIDAGTLHLEAEEWAERNDEPEGDAVLLGNMPELCPVDFPSHRRKTDELLALLNGNLNSGRQPLIPKEFFLAQNYPNPFNSTTKIEFGLSKDAMVKLRIYDIQGREVATIVNKEMRAGFYAIPWQGLNKGGAQLASGVYLYRIQTPEFVKTRKMTLLK